MRSRHVARVGKKRFIGVALVVGICLLLFGCTTTIIPPASPVRPTSVCIVDYGRHASLVLPEGNGSVEYEYGEWKWFALGQDQSSRIVPTLFWPTQGTLGRRQLPYPPELKLLKSQKSSELVQAVYCIKVADEKAQAVREQLAARYNAGLKAEIFNQEYKMSFIKDPADYTIFHNCNHELAAWLRRLGCRTKGSAVFSRFKVHESLSNP